MTATDTRRPKRNDALLSNRNPLCFIGGTGRSGTTLLRQIFALHRDVATLPSEARFLTDPDGVVDFWNAIRAAWSPFIFDVRVRRLEKLLRDLGSSAVFGAMVAWIRRRGQRGTGGRRNLRDRVPPAIARLLPRYWSVSLRSTCASYDQLVSELIACLVEFEYAGRWMGTPSRQSSTIKYVSPHVADALRSFCRRFAACVCEAQGATHFVEDTPSNLTAFDSIRALLPEGRLVHIYRDPRDVVASYLQRRWSPSDPLLAARFYASIMERWESVRSTLPGDSYIEVSLKSLVERPEPILHRICSFWELPWEDALLDVDLSRSNSGRWKRDIPAATFPRVQELLRPYLERYGDEA